LDLIFNDNAFYWQNILLTDTSVTGRYNNSAILQQFDERYRLTSTARRIIQWDQQNRIVITQD
jgi:hypothetical protein